MPAVSDQPIKELILQNERTLREQLKLTEPAGLRDLHDNCAVGRHVLRAIYMGHGIQGLAKFADWAEAVEIKSDPEFLPQSMPAAVFGTVSDTLYNVHAERRAGEKRIHGDLEEWNARPEIIAAYDELRQALDRVVEPGVRGRL